jgi:RimJ/RimL family protein N-acetyltransferase
MDNTRTEWLAPVILRGEFITLVPLERQHAEDLFQVMRDPEVCRYLLFSPPTHIDETIAMIETARTLMARGNSIVFAQVWNETGRAIGSTRLLDVKPADRQVEIGSTFLAREYWRTAANTESKYLFLRHCFEKLGCIRVALKTDGRNIRSQQAIERLGAVREGVLRKHMNVKGYQRDTVYYSILDTEWPQVRVRLEGRLGRTCDPERGPAA